MKLDDIGKSPILWYLSVALTLILVVLGVGTMATAAPDVYLPVITSDSSLSATIFATNSTTTMDVKLSDGRLHISDSVHSTKNLRVLESMLINRLSGYNGENIMLSHINDAGIMDSSRLVPVKSDGTWTYFYDVEFSEVIIDGFAGTLEVTAYNLSVSDSLNFGQTFNASNVTSLPVNVTDDATKTNPYDINTTGLVGWWKLDDDYLDSSGNGNNGTTNSTDIHFDNGKYNNGTVFNGVNDYVDCGNDESLNITDAITIAAWVKPDDITGSYRVIASKFGSGQSAYRTYQSAQTVGLHINEVTVYSGDVLSVGTWTYVVFTYNKSLASDNLKVFVNGIQKVQTNLAESIITNSQVLRIGSGMPIEDTYHFNGSIDDVLIYNRALSADEIESHYLDNLEQFQINTSSNTTYSDYWNSTADNPIQVPYGAGELFNLLNFTVPDTVVQNGITIYDYPSTVQLDAIATVGYTEDTTKITETATASTYILNITHATANTGTGYINYTTTNTLLLDADFRNSATLSTDNSNASLSSALPNFNISTGYVAAATEYYYLVEQDYFYPPTNIQTTPSQTSVYIEWDAVPNADNYSVYELEDGFPYIDTNPVIDGVKDAIYNYSHEFLIFSPNPVNPGDYETIYPLRTSLGAYFLIESVDNDNKKGDDDTIYYFDLDNNGLTTNDYAWKITDNIVKRYHWDGASWKVSGGSSAVGASTGAGTHYPIHELFIPIAELGANWTNGSTVKVLVKREDSSLHPDVVTWYPYGNINNTDTALWQEMVLNQPCTYILLANVTLSNYTATNLTPFTIYHGAVSAWNGLHESSYTLFDVITKDLPVYTVSGYVLDAEGNPITDATVYACNAFVHEITTTNESGYWIGYNFRNDTYTICANAVGYYGNSTSLTVAGVNLTNVNITLVTVPAEEENIVPLPLFITWSLILFALMYVSYPRRDEDEEADIGTKNITTSFISVILAFTLAKISINGQLVQTFAGVSSTDTIVTGTQVIQISWLGWLYTFIGVSMVILTLMMLVSIYKNTYDEVPDE